MRETREKKAKNPELTEKIAKERKPRVVKFGITLNEEQKEAKRIFLDESDVSAFLGSAGSGKTLLSVQIALDMYFKGECKKIIIARPAVEAGEKIGFLPGDLEEKMNPFLQPLYDNMYQLIGKETVTKLLAEGVIEIMPFGFMRGKTFLNAIIICDEIQNTTKEQLEMALGRIGKGSKLILCGDEAQIDLPNKSYSSMKMIDYIGRNDPRFKVVRLKTNHRHEIVERLLLLCEKYHIDNRRISSDK